MPIDTVRTATELWYPMEQSSSPFSRVAHPGDYHAWPVRSIEGVVGWLSGSDLLEGGGGLLLRGSSERTAWYLDGVPHGGVPLLPFRSVGPITVWIDHLPPAFGGTTTGGVEVQTGGVRLNRWQGWGEGLTSRGLDAYGQSLGAFSLEGPVARNLSVWLVGEVEDRREANPRAVETPRLSASDRATLLQNPQVIAVGNPQTGETRFLPLPGDLPAGTTVEQLQGLLPVPAGFTQFLTRPIDAVAVFDSEQFGFSPTRPEQEQRLMRLHGGAVWQWSPALRAWFDVSLLQDTYRLYQPQRLAFNYEAFPEGRSRRYAWSGGLAYAAPGRSMRGQLLARLEQQRVVEYDPRFSDSVEDLLFYGDLDHPANAVMRRYYRFDDPTGTYVPAFRDGADALLGAVYAIPGTGPVGYFKARNDARHLSGHLSGLVQGHRLTVGGVYTRQAGRQYRVAAPTTLARYYDDGVVEAGTGGVTTWEAFTPAQLAGNTTYHGYNYLGTETATAEDLAAFTTTDGLQAGDSALDQAPFRPWNAAAFGREEWSWARLHLDLGLRVERFGTNGRTPYDPFNLYPVRRAGDLAIPLPTGIRDDFTVYFEAGQVTGYRDRQGQFYNPQGTPVTSDVDVALVARSVEPAPGVVLGQLHAAAFQDAPGHTVLLPRLAAAFDLVRTLALFGWYDRMAWQPVPFLHETLQGYQRRLQGAGTLLNPSLKPERSTRYGGGVRVGALPGQPGVSARLSAFLQHFEDLVAEDVRTNVFPFNYRTFTNRGAARLIGGSLELNWRSDRLHLMADYTFEGGRTEDQAYVVFLLGTPFVGATEALVRTHPHRLTAQVNGRLDREGGPRLLGGHPLAHTTFSLAAQARSGFRYSQPLSPFPFFLPTEDPLVTEVNGATMPWTYRIDLRLEKTFHWSSNAQVAVFLWVENLLDTQNVVDIYEATGTPDDDGWLDTVEGRAFIGENPTLAAFYRLRLPDPSHYGLPRLVRLGLRLGF